MNRSATDLPDDERPSTVTAGFSMGLVEIDQEPVSARCSGSNDGCCRDR